MHHEPLRNHPNVLSILGYGWKTYGESLLPYIIVEYCDHGSLRDWLGGCVKEITTKLILVGDVAAGITALHMCGIVHGDLKLDNVVVLPSWDRPANAIAKLCDFGHSIILGGDIKQPKYYGTLLYNAPEVTLQEAFGIEPTLLYKCDIWAYGLVVWEIFADGKKYFNREWEADDMLNSRADLCQNPDSKLGHLITNHMISSQSSSGNNMRYFEAGNMAPRASHDAKQTGKETTTSVTTFGSFDQKHLRVLGRAFILRIPFPNCTVEKGYILKLLDRTLEVDASIRLSRITPIPIMTKWNQSNLSSLKEKLAIHTGSASLSFKMFRVDEEREIPWEHQCQILLDLERIATPKSGFDDDTASAAMQVAICYILGFGTSLKNDSAIGYLRRAEELGHPMATLFGRGLQNVLGGFTTETEISYDKSVVRGIQKQTELNGNVFELHDFETSGRVHRFPTYGDFRIWLWGLERSSLSALTSASIATVPPTSKMNVCEFLIAMDDIASIQYLADWPPLIQQPVYGHPLIIQACRKGNTKLVRFLLDAGVDAENCTEHGLTACHFLFMLGEGAPEIGRHLSRILSTSTKAMCDRPCSKKHLLHPQWPLELEGSPLAFSIAAGSKVGVETLLNMGADPTAPIYGLDKADDFCSSWTPIHLAIKYQFCDALELLLAAARQRLLAAKPGVLEQEPSNQTVSDSPEFEFPYPRELWGDLACSAAYLTTLEIYAIHGRKHRQRLLDTMKKLPPTSLGQPRKDGRVPIMQAIDHSDIDLVESLLQLKPTLLRDEVHDPKNRSAYDVPMTFASQIAARQDSSRTSKIVRKLGELEAAHFLRDSHGRVPLHLAVTGTFSSVAEWLIEHGSSVHQLDRAGRTPLHYCGSAANVRILLGAGAYINQIDYKGFTPVHLAALAGSEDIVRCLIERGANLKIAHPEFGTALHCAVSKRSRPVVLLLLEHALSSKDPPPLDINSCHCGNKDSPLHLAARTSRTDLVRILLDHGANPALKNASGLTPLHQCVLTESPELVRSFLDFVDVTGLIHVPNAEGDTALHLAARAGNSTIVEHLLGYGADVDSVNNEGDTALNLAVAAKHSADRLQTCKALHSRGATLLVENNRKMCAWDFARCRLDYILMEFLLKKGGPQACRYETLPGNQHGQRLINDAIDKGEFAFVALLLSSGKPGGTQEEGNKRSRPAEEPDPLGIEISPDFRQMMVDELNLFFEYFTTNQESLAPVKDIIFMGCFWSAFVIETLRRCTNSVADHLAIVALHSFIDNHKSEPEQLSIPGIFSDRIMASKFAIQLEQALDPSTIFNETTLKKLKGIVQQVVRISDPLEDESIIKTYSSAHHMRLLFFLCRLNYREVMELEEELEAACMPSQIYHVGYLSQAVQNEFLKAFNASTMCMPRDYTLP